MAVSEPKISTFIVKWRGEGNDEGETVLRSLVMRVGRGYGSNKVDFVLHCCGFFVGDESFTSGVTSRSLRFDRYWTMTDWGRWSKGWGGQQEWPCPWRRVIHGPERHISTPREQRTVVRSRIREDDGPYGKKGVEVCRRGRVVTEKSGKGLEEVIVTRTGLESVG